MKNHFWAYPKGCREFKAILDSNVYESLVLAFFHGSRAVKRAARRKINKLAKSQPTIRDESKVKK